MIDKNNNAIEDVFIPSKEASIICGVSIKTLIRNGVVRKRDVSNGKKGQNNVYSLRSLIQFKRDRDRRKKASA